MVPLKCLLFFLIAFTVNTPSLFAQQSGSIPLNSGSIYYESSGKGKPIVFVHAGFQDHRMWNAQAEYFKKDYKVIVFDNPGHGHSISGHERPTAAHVIKTLMDSLKLAKAVVVGLSLGGAMSLDFAIQHQERVEKLVLVGSGLSGWDEDRKVDTTTTQYVKALFGALEAKDTTLAAKTFVNYWYAGPNRNQTHIDTAVWKYGMKTTLDNMLKHKVSGWPQFAKPAAILQLSKIQMPVLIITGTQDMPEVLLMNKWLKEHIKGAQQIFVENTAHMVNLEKPDLFNQILHQFLKH